MEAATWTLIALLAATVFGASLGARIDAQSVRIDAMTDRLSEHITHHTG